MAAWILVPCLVSLRNEFDQLAPDRDHATDGSIGDAAHAAEPSDHNPDETGQGEGSDADNINEVHAIDVDADLRRPGWNMHRAVALIVARHRSGQDSRLHYIIWDRLYWSAENDWEAYEYEGTNPHTDHAHFSARYDTASESNTRPWGLLEGDDMTRDDFMNILWDGFHAAKQDDEYKKASPARQKEMRNVRDLFRGIIGGPTDLTPIMTRLDQLAGKK